MIDFNLQQMKQLLGKDNVSILYLHAEGDYWVRQQEFCNEFKSVPISDDIVIHVQFEGLSLTHSLVVPAVEKIIKEIGRSNNSVYIFSPNSIMSDAPWENIFWRQYHISDEFMRSKLYWCSHDPVVDDFKTWALFVGRKTTPRLLALYDIFQDPVVKENFLLSAMNEASKISVQVFDQPDKIYDSIDIWLPQATNKLQTIFQYHMFRTFCQNLPVSSVDNYSLDDQYLGSLNGENRNPEPSKSLIKLGSRYLFELTFETMTRGFTFTPSEKTIRTIVAEKPLIVYAPRHFLKNLQNLKFKTFDSLWDESYDNLEGPERYKAIMKIVKEICMLSKDQQQELYQQSRDICAYNKLHLAKININKMVKI